MLDTCDRTGSHEVAGKRRSRMAGFYQGAELVLANERLNRRNHRRAEPEATESDAPVREDDFSVSTYEGRKRIASVIETIISEALDKDVTD